MRFDFATATQILFGAGRIRELGDILGPIGRSVLVVTGSSAERAAPALESLAGREIPTRLFHVTGEPTTEIARQGIALARAEECEAIVGIGGGSTLDTGKAIAALLTNGGDPLDYLEVIGAGREITVPSAPFVAIPTTAGTGSEVTRNAVLASKEHSVKVSLRSPLMLPRVALVDPELTHSMPPAVTASTGLDALTQVLEPFVSCLATPMTDGICREGLGRAARSLRRAYEHGDDAAAREDMALVSLFGGLALANAKLGAAHGLAGPLGGMFDAPHGALCARLLPAVMETNVAALRARAPNCAALARYDEVGRILTSRTNVRAEEGVAWVREVSAVLAVPSLRTYGISESDLEDVAAKARVASSMRGNPIELTREELLQILSAAL